MHQLLMAIMIDFTLAVSTLSAVQKQNLYIDASVMISMVTAIVLMIAAMMCCPWMHTLIKRRLTIIKNHIYRHYIAKKIT